jgi:hypothetical protein
MREQMLDVVIKSEKVSLGFNGFIARDLEK